MNDDTEPMPQTRSRSIMPEATESPYAKFFWLVVTAAIGFAGMTIAGVVSINSRQAAYEERQRAQDVQLVDIKATLISIDLKLESATRSRYTTEDALRDRASLLAALERNNSKDDAQDVRLLDLVERVTRIESANGISKK